ncbi:spore germination protein [Paenibacillus sp. DMB20]|uniref:spore germination protein n=1 Tax=Paenibacillus sp. DMB20 TaxID=1642570 RepID=UPI0009E1B1B5|nr:spore germination protein [Paenibacillus sp. DMB20]
MLSWILKKLGNRKHDTPTQNQPADFENNSLGTDLDETIRRIQQRLGSSSDLIVRKFKLGTSPSPAAAVYIDNLADKKTVNETVMTSLMDGVEELAQIQSARQEHKFEIIYERVLKIGEASEISDWNALIMSLLSGETVLIIDGCGKAIGCGTKGGDTRGVEEPTSQVAIRGPKDGFNESLGTNIALIRRRIKNPDLRIDSMKIGKATQTNTAIMYIQGKADEAVVREVKKRFGEAQIEAILESGYLEKLLEDKAPTFFPTVYNTERPDAVSMNLLDGRVAIFVDGTPFVLIVPTIFFQFFHTTEDRYNRNDIRVFLRVLRYVGFIISILLPSLYVAAVTYHQDLIPTTLLIHIAASREGVPFPALVEAILLEFSFEVLREAGIRMPRAVGQAVSIVGALVLGQAAVQAGIISPAMLIVVSITGIASFATPSYNLAIAARLIRLLFLLLAAAFGFFGLVVAFIVLTAHLSSLRSLGVPYLSPFAPYRPAVQHKPDPRAKG